MKRDARRGSDEGGVSSMAEILSKGETREPRGSLTSAGSSVFSSRTLVVG